MERISLGLNSNEWHSMSDERRSQFMRDKRKSEAFKTEMCKGFIRTGGCRYGMECRFAHDQAELRLRPIHPKYKTELCLNFSKSGHCGYGSRCQFIHRSPDQGRSRSTSASGHLTNSTYSTGVTQMDFHRSLQPQVNFNHHRAAAIGYNNFFQSCQRQEIMHQQQVQAQALTRLYADFVNSLPNGENGCASSCENGRAVDGSCCGNGNLLPPMKQSVGGLRNGCVSAPPPLSGVASRDGDMKLSTGLTSPFPSSRFAMSAYVPRERHPVLQTRTKPTNGDCSFLERENSIDNILSLMRGETAISNKRVNFASDADDWKTISADFKQWTPFSGVFGETPPNSSPPANGIS